MDQLEIAAEEYLLPGVACDQNSVAAECIVLENLGAASSSDITSFDFSKSRSKRSQDLNVKRSLKRAKNMVIAQQEEIKHLKKELQLAVVGIGRDSENDKK